MPAWLLGAVGFLGQRWLHILVWGAIAAASYGIYHKLFVQPTSKTVIHATNYWSESPAPRVTFLGCSAGALKAGLTYSK